MVRKTPKGQPSTAEDVLQELAAEHALPALILEQRGLSKLKSTYTDRLPEKIREDTGRVHTHYHQATTATGRLSSTDPNLQNIPIRTEEGRRIRKAFVAPDGWCIVAADYSQVELRIMAHMSGDERLLKAFADREDIHRATASEVFGVELDQVTGEQRRSAKAINFGLMYGMSAWGLARQLETDRTTAAEYIDRYFARYPGVREFMDNPQAGQAAGLCRDAGRAPAVAARDQLAQPPAPAGRRARRHQRPAAGHRRRHHQARHDRRRPLDRIRSKSTPGWSCRSTTNSCSRSKNDALDEVRQGVIERMSAAAELDVELLVEAGAGKDWDSAH